MAKVLVVDDDADILRLVEVRLLRAGHQVMPADGATAALTLIEQGGSPDLAVLDVGLPGVDGLQLLDAIRERAGLRSMPAVFLCARGMPEDIAKGEAMGAAYLTKPFVPSDLLAAVEAAVSGARSPGGREGAR
jgi:DNA-binding response OmpR family regulator